MSYFDALGQFVQGGRAAAVAANAIGSFATSLQAFGCEEYFSRMLTLARARSKTSDRSAESFLVEMSSAIAAGEGPDKVLASFAQAAQLDAEASEIPETLEDEAMRKIAGSDLLHRIASCSHHYPPGSRTCSRCGLELTG